MVRSSRKRRVTRVNVPPMKSMASKTDDVIREIVRQHVSGTTPHQISKNLGIHHLTVKRHISAFEGTAPAPKKKGRPVQYGPDFRRRVVRAVREQQAPSVAALRRRSTKVCAKPSESTLRSILKDAGVVKKKKVRVQKLEQKHKDRRVAFATANRFTDFTETFFSDETRLEASGSQDEVLCEKHVHPGFKECTQRVPTVMFWGAVRVDGTRVLLPIEGTLNADKYKKVLTAFKRTLPSPLRQAPVTLMQDGATPHSPKLCRHALLGNRITLVQNWPARSPDLNPIENIWAILKRKVRLRAPLTEEELKRVAIEEFGKLSAETISNTCKSINSRLEAVLGSKGNHLK
jgi:transposase